VHILYLFSLFLYLRVI